MASLTRQWLALLALSLNSMLNAYMSMNTSSAEDAFSKALGVDSDEIGKLYSYFLFSVMGGMTPGMIFCVSHEGLAVSFSVVMNVTAVWLRWLCVRQGSYPLCVLSTVVAASGAWTILSLPPQFSQERFPPEKWTLTTSLMVQANYCGWLIGAIIPPQFATDSDSLLTLCWYQAIVATPVLLLFVAFYRPVPKENVELGSALRNSGSRSGTVSARGSETRPGSRVNGSVGALPSANGSIGRHAAASHLSTGGAGGGHSLSSGSFYGLLRVSIDNPRFLLQVIGFGLLGGVSFAQPSAAIFILKAHGFRNTVSTLVNVAFLGVGVVSGVLLGRFCRDARHFAPTLKVLFIVCTTCLAACAVLVASGFIQEGDAGSLLLIMCLSAGAGATSLGFIGIAIESAALYPVGSGHVCWLIEFIIQGVGGGLNFWAANGSGFVILAATAGVGTVAALLGCHKLAEV